LLPVAGEFCGFLNWSRSSDRWPPHLPLVISDAYTAAAILIVVEFEPRKTRETKVGSILGFLFRVFRVFRGSPSLR
jgi:hypothetical protein